MQEKEMENSTTIKPAKKNWLADSDNPIIIAGPCSAESEQQVLKTAHELVKIQQVKIFRSGIWKPRTRPNGFEGIGSVGFQWLQKIKSETGLMTAVEVATSHHVEEALTHNIDILWIGARTSVNPFSVREIAHALEGVDIPVLVKNPINPDINSWIGALERISQAGISRLGAIHRGFSTFEKTPYRNDPKWEIPIELKRQIPEIPLLSDPSHIAGNRKSIQELAQYALDLAMDGLMIESHIDPDAALSDAYQQLTPDCLQDIVNKLHFTKPGGTTTSDEDMLTKLRKEIDLADTALLEALLHRNNIAQKIGEYKKDQNMTILQIDRWQELLQDRLHQARQMGIDEQLIADLYQLIHNRSIKIQSNMINQTN
jgi:chorismate mutase